MLMFFHEIKNGIKISLALLAAVALWNSITPSLHAAPISLEDNRDHDKYQTFTGEVLRVRDRQFDLRVENVVYSVRSSKPLPYGIDEGYRVRVYGELDGRHSIRDANTMVISSGDKSNDANTRHGYETIFGVVTAIQSDLELEVRAGRMIYYIFLARKKPAQLKVGNEVRVFGPRYGWNTIRSATLKTIKGNPDERFPKRYQEFIGTVATVKSRSGFEIHISEDTEKTTYNVYLSQPMPRQLSKDDVVSVYGQRFGKNDIRHADAIILHNERTEKDRKDNDFDSFVGTVVAINSRKSFDLRMGNTIYKVTTAVETPRRLHKNDRVRVYGQHSGSHSIIEADIYVMNR